MRIAGAQMPALTPRHRRAIRDGLVIAGLVYLAYRFVVIAPQEGTVGSDAFAYWSLDPAHQISAELRQCACE